MVEIFHQLQDGSDVNIYNNLKYDVLCYFERDILVIYLCFQIFSHRPPFETLNRIYCFHRKWQNSLNFSSGCKRRPR